MITAGIYNAKEDMQNQTLPNNLAWESVMKLESNSLNYVKPIICSLLVYALSKQIHVYMDITR